jgi:hypothetical protein
MVPFQRIGNPGGLIKKVKSLFGLINIPNFDLLILRSGGDDVLCDWVELQNLYFFLMARKHQIRLDQICLEILRYPPEPDETIVGASEHNI